MSADEEFSIDYSSIVLPSRPPGISPADEETETVIDPTFLNENPEWKQAREVVNKNLNDIASWDILITLTEQLLVKYTSMNEIVKNVISKTFMELLGRFPLLFGYWKKYTAVQYQLNGIDESVKVLSTALDVFPTSIDLWIDYLNILVSNFSEEKDKIRLNFEIASKYIGNQFLSHPFWDKFIEFETSEQNVTAVFKILLRVIRIPLHQYAKYYQAFSQLLQSISIKEILDNEKDLEIDVQQLSEEQQRLKASEYFNNVFLVTQAYVSEIWTFESQIKLSYFNLAPIPKQEIINWDNYLNYQIERLHKDRSHLNKLQTISVFERSLIPTALYPKFWQKYIFWYLENFPEEFNEIDNVYKRAINQFIPINYVDIRLNYALFLESRHQESDKIHDVYLSILNYIPNDLKLISRYIKFISRKLKNFKKLTEVLEAILSNYFNRSKTELEVPYKRLLLLLNDKTISMVIIELIKTNWYFYRNHLNVKKLLNYYSKEGILSGSIGFWTLNYKYYKQCGDLKALVRVTSFIKFESSLPLSIIDTILLDYAEYLKQNFQDSNTSIFELDNHSRILELEYDVSHPLHYRTQNDPQFKKSLKSQSGHPGISIEKPSVTNSITDQVASRSEVPNFPTFRNVEKAALPIEYPTEEI